MIEPTCTCAVCARRAAQGLPKFAGISVSTGAHVLAEELEPPKPEQRASEQPQQASSIKHIIRGEIEKYADSVLLPGIAEALGTMINELRAELVAKMEEAAISFRGEWQAAATYRRGN